MNLLPRLKARLEHVWPTASLRTYLFAVMLLATLPMAALMCVHRFGEIRNEQARIDEELAASAGALAAAVERQLRSSLEGLDVLAQSELFQQGRVAALGRLLQGRPRGDWDSVFLLDRQGAVVLDTGQPRPSANTEELRALHRQVLRGEPAVSGLWEQGPEQRWTAVAVPIVQNGQVRYVLGARMDESVWQWLSTGARRPAAANAAVVDARGRLLGASTATVPRADALPTNAAGEMARDAAGVQRSSDIDGSAVHAAWHTIPLSGWRVRVTLPAGPIDAAHRRATVTALAASGGSLLLGLLLAGLVARRVAQPLRQLAANGGAGLPSHVPVREIAALRDALMSARTQDAAAHTALQAKDAVPLRDGRGRPRGGLSALVDISERKHAEERLRATDRQIALAPVAAKQEAEAASRAQDEFLTMLSHELRNPLSAISAAVDVLESAPPDSATAGEARKIIARQTRNLAQMLNDLLDVGRVIAGKIELARQPVELAALVQRLDRTLAITGEAAEHPLHLRLQPVWVDGDPVRIEQVVSNLLTNAIKYTPAGRPIRVGVRQEGDTAVLEVQDAGTGIPSALLPHVFDLFVQGERGLDRHAGGLGIGLTLVRRLTEQHGGTVDVESSEEGSRFTVRLPAIAAHAEQRGDSLPAERRRNVLVVEDNGDVLDALRAKLELDGHSVSTAADGIQGLQCLLRLRPEVSIVDIGLPGLTGFQLARHARAAGYAGRMIAMSGYGAERDAKDALVAGFDAYLVKPIDRNQLRASLGAQ